MTVRYPGCVASEMDEKASACVPPLPWAPMSVLVKHGPLPLLKRLV